MNPPTSHNFQTQSKSFPTDMQITRQEINNTNHPSSALKATCGPSFSYNIPQNSSAALSSHMQTTRQAINNTNHLSSSFQPAIRPSFLYDMRQNSSSPSSTRQAINNTNHLSSSFQPDLLSEVEINLADQYEQNLLSEVEIIDGNGNILRTQKMTAKQVYKLNGGEKTYLCPRCQGSGKECKDSCAAMLIAELRRRFSIPQGESVDKVLSTMLSRKRRTVKYRLKMSLYQQAANKLNEANGINGLDAQEKTYTEDELLAALDLLEPPENFLEHQWRVYKSHLRKPIAKDVCRLVQAIKDHERVRSDRASFTIYSQRILSNSIALFSFSEVPTFKPIDAETAGNSSQEGKVDGVQTIVLLMKLDSVSENALGFRARTPSTLLVLPMSA
ncbi:hypothetical protein Tco_1300098 [Tanacetum coccineum]